jgi:hypothetical protein
MHKCGQIYYAGEAVGERNLQPELREDLNRGYAPRRPGLNLLG